MIFRTPVLPSSLLIAIPVSLALLTIVNFAWQATCYGLDGSIDVEAIMSATFIFFFGSMFAICAGMPIYLFVFVARHRLLVAPFGLALFGAIGGLVNSSPVLTFEGWLYGALGTAGFGLLFIMVAALIQLFREPASV